ncbi:TPA: LysM peptidoglycan-binding domain-containing protein, partial [Bacillus cereus]|nr:LysM peptidoglycan-binding domain-containing protein [Bacillus cereus]
VRKHIVQKGETLFLIGKQYGVNEEEMKKANPDIDPKNLEIGSTVNIPIDAREPGNATPKVRKHIVQEGETLFLIGKQYGVNEEEMKKANPGIDPKNLEIGSTVNIPIDVREPRNDSASTIIYRVHHNPDIGRYDTIEKIAKKFKINPIVIKDANPRININTTPDGGSRILIPITSVPIPSEHVAITSNHHKVWNFFINEGFSATATAGIMGNLQQESGMDPKKNQLNGGPGRGIAQWETRRDGTGRWDDLTRKAHGRERDLNVQLENILYELTEISWISGILESFGGMNSLKKMGIYQAVVTFEQTFEQASKPSFPERFAFANSIYRSLASNIEE